MRVDLTDAAVDDLRSIRSYTLEIWGDKQEQVYLDALWRQFGEILTDPTHYRFRHDLFPDCQLASAGKHVILFRIRKDVLQVVRVLHSAMDFKRHL